MTENQPTVIDAKGLILGRMATQVAKKLRAGETVKVINCEQAVVSGNKKQVLERCKIKRNYGHALTGPFVSRRPDFYVRRVIRGMLPHKKPSGKTAFGRLRCYIGVPPEFEKAKAETIKEASYTKLRIGHVTIQEICRYLGGKQ